MAKNTEAKAPASTPPPAAQSQEITDTRTGEVMTLAPRGGVSTKGTDAVDAQLAVLAGNAGFLDKLKKAEALKVDDFKEVEKDFWKPSKAGDFIQGVFAGSQKVGRILQHAVVKLGKDGKPYAVRMNEGFALTNALKQVAPGQGVRIEFLGQQTTKGIANESGQGNTMGMWKVTKVDL